MSMQWLGPSTDNQWVRGFIDRGEGLHAETAPSALTVILKLVLGGLTSVVLGAISAQFRGLFPFL